MEDSRHPQAALHSEMPGSIEISSNVAPTSALVPMNAMPISKTIDKESQTSGSLAYAQDDGYDTLASPFLKLPAEIRVRIYRYLLYAFEGIYIDTVRADSSRAPKAIFRRHFPNQDCNNQWSDFGKMATYRVEATDVHPAILSVNRQTFLEASKLFYSKNSFKFHSGSTCVIPFLENRSEGSRHLIKQIELTSDILAPGSIEPPDFGHLKHLFENNCNYLSRCLQLEHMTLKYYHLSPLQRNTAAYKDYLSNIDKQSWVQQSVPLVKHLKSFRLMHAWNNVEDDLTLATQTFLESKMEKGKQ